MEFVYVVKRFDLFERACPHGLLVPDAAGMEGLLGRIRSRGFFVERRPAEPDASMKQVIPYCVVTRGDEVFLTRRVGGGDGTRRGDDGVTVGRPAQAVEGILRLHQHPLAPFLGVGHADRPEAPALHGPRADEGDLLAVRRPGGLESILNELPRLATHHRLAVHRSNGAFIAQE